MGTSKTKTNGHKGLRAYRPQRTNANKHTPAGLGALRKSIQGDGIIGAITVARDGESFDGSARLETLAEAMPGVKIIEVETDGATLIVNKRRDIPNANSPRARRLGVAANIIAKMDYNPDGEILAALAAEDAQIAELVKAERDSLKAVQDYANANGNADAEPQIDRAEELNKKWKVKTGDLWRIGEHRLLCGDSTVRADVERVMAGEKADCLMVDPPYGMDLDTEFTNMPETRIASNSYERIQGDDEDFDAGPFIEQFKYVDEQFWWGADYYYQSLPPHGSWLIWDKRNENSDGLIGNHFETCWSRTRHRRKMVRKHWSGVNARNPGFERLHPTEKPVAVLVDVLGEHTKEGGVVVDLFSGSGTTLVACQNLQRRCRAIEISPGYVAVTLERMATAFPGIEIERME